MPRLSVLMPAYNAQETIATAIRSTLRAMPADSELVVYDDTSSDDTAAVAGAQEDARVRIIHGDVNVGGGAARNALLSATESEYVAFMDADDVSLPWRFRTQLGLLERNRSIDAVFSNVARFSDRKIRPTLPTRLTAKEFSTALLFHNPAYHPTFAARRSSLASFSYSTARVAQDYELWLRLVAQDKAIVRTASPVLLYRESPTQVSNGNDYADRVRNEPLLRSSYTDLLSKMTGKTLDDQAVKASTLRDALEPLLRNFNGLNRFWYARLLERNRMLVPLAQEDARS